MNFYGCYKTGNSVSLMISGCRYEFCAVPEVRDFAYGEPVTTAVEQDVIKKLGEPGVDTLYICGGDAFEAENISGVTGLLRNVKKARPDVNICAWSMHHITDIVTSTIGRELLHLVDALVDCSGCPGSQSILNVHEALQAAQAVAG